MSEEKKPEQKMRAEDQDLEKAEREAHRDDPPETDKVRRPGGSDAKRGDG